MCAITLYMCIRSSFFLSCSPYNFPSSYARCISLYSVILFHFNIYIIFFFFSQSAISVSMFVCVFILLLFRKSVSERGARYGGNEKTFSFMNNLRLQLTDDEFLYILSFSLRFWETFYFIVIISFWLCDLVCNTHHIHAQTRMNTIR